MSGIRESQRSRSGKPARQQFSRYDQRLLAAKNSDSPVKITLAWVTPYSDEDGQLVCKILEVDKYDILVLAYLYTNGGNPEVWLKKSSIVATEVL